MIKIYTIHDPKRHIHLNDKATPSDKEVLINIQKEIDGKQLLVSAKTYLFLRHLFLSQTLSHSNIMVFDDSKANEIKDIDEVTIITDVKKIIDIFYKVEEKDVIILADQEMGILFLPYAETITIWEVPQNKTENAKLFPIWDISKYALSSVEKTKNFNKLKYKNEK